MNFENWTLKEIKDCCTSFSKTKENGSKTLLCNQCIISSLCFKTFAVEPYCWDLKEEYIFNEKEMEFIYFLENYGLSKIEKVSSEEIYFKDKSGKILTWMPIKNTLLFNNLPIGNYDISELTESEE